MKKSHAKNKGGKAFKFYYTLILLYNTISYRTLYNANAVLITVLKNNDVTIIGNFFKVTSPQPNYTTKKRIMLLIYNYIKFT